MAAVLYIEINLICIFLLVWILISFIKNYDRQLLHILFRNVLVANICMMAVDVLWQFVKGYPGRFRYYANIFLSVSFVSLTALDSMFWYFFVQRIWYEILGIKNPSRNKFKIFLQVFPAVIFVFLTIISPWTKSIFYIDKTTNIYHKSSGYLFQQILTYFYFTSASTGVLIAFFRKRRKYTWITTPTIFALVFLLLFSGIANILWIDLPVAWPVISVLMAFVFFDMQIARVSTDGLTGLNNRRLFNKYIDSSSVELRPGSSLFLYMIDINKFKSINDRFGHQEGDNALVGVSEVLRNVFKGKDCFISRYGGDEFAVLLWTKNSAEPSVLKESIHENLALFTTKNNLKYDLSLEIGLSERDKSCLGNSELFIQRADNALYEAKRYPMS